MVEVDSDYFAAPEDSGDISISGEEEMDQESSQYAVMVKQCQLKRARFTYQGQEAHSIENYGGKTNPPISSRAKAVVPIITESDVESIHSEAVTP